MLHTAASLPVLHTTWICNFRDNFEDMNFKHPVMDGARGHTATVQQDLLPAWDCTQPQLQLVLDWSCPTKQPHGLTALQPRVKMSGSTEHLPRTRMSSSPFHLNKILISFSRTDSIAAQQKQTEWGRNQRCWETAFSIDSTWGEKTHTAPCMEAAFPGSGHASISGLDYPAHSWCQTGRSMVRAHPRHLWGNHICPRQCLPHHLPCIHQHRKRLEKHSYPPHSQWAGSPIHYLDLVGFGLIWFLDRLINVIVTAN